MKYIVVLCLTISLVFNGCAPRKSLASEEKPKPCCLYYKDDFESDYFSWQKGYCSYNSTNSFNYIKKSHLPINHSKGLALSLSNRGQHSFLFITKKIDASLLKPNTTYHLKLNLDLITNKSFRDINRFGAPGLDTFLKAGILTNPPALKAPLNFDIGFGEKGGKDLITVDHIATSITDSNLKGFSIKPIHQVFPINYTNQNLWLIIGIDTVYQGYVKVFIDNIEIQIDEIIKPATE